MNDNIDMNLFGADPFSTSVDPTDESLLGLDFEDIDPTGSTQNDILCPWQGEELWPNSTTDTGMQTTEAQSGHISDSNGCLATLQCPAVFGGGAPNPHPTSSNMAWSSTQLGPDYSGTTSHGIRASEYTQPSEHAPILALASLPVGPVEAEANLTFQTTDTISPALIMGITIPSEISLQTGPCPGLPISSDLDQHTFDVANARMPDLTSLQDVSWDLCQEQCLAQYESLPLDDQSSIGLPAPQNFSSEPIHQLPSHPTKVFNVPSKSLAKSSRKSDPISTLCDIEHSKRNANSRQYPQIRPSEQTGPTHLSTSRKGARRLQKPSRRKGAHCVPASRLNVFSTNGARKEPRKKTNHSCLNCIWNRKGCSGTLPCQNCLAAAYKPGIRPAMCIRTDISELNIFRDMDIWFQNVHFKLGEEYSVSDVQHQLDQEPSYTRARMDLDFVSIRPIYIKQYLTETSGRFHIFSSFFTFLNPLRDAVTLMVQPPRDHPLEPHLLATENRGCLFKMTAIWYFGLLETQMKRISKLPLQEILFLLLNFLFVKRSLQIDFAIVVEVNDEIKETLGHLEDICHAMVVKYCPIEQKENPEYLPYFRNLSEFEEAIGRIEAARFTKDTGDESGDEFEADSVYKSDTSA